MKEAVICEELKESYIDESAGNRRKNRIIGNSYMFNNEKRFYKLLFICTKEHHVAIGECVLKTIL